MVIKGMRKVYGPVIPRTIRKTRSRKTISKVQKRKIQTHLKKSLKYKKQWMGERRKLFRALGLKTRKTVKGKWRTGRVG